MTSSAKQSTTNCMLHLLFSWLVPAWLQHWLQHCYFLELQPAALRQEGTSLAWVKQFARFSFALLWLPGGRICMLLFNSQEKSRLHLHLFLFLPDSLS